MRSRHVKHQEAFSFPSTYKHISRIHSAESHFGKMNQDKSPFPMISCRAATKHYFYCGSICSLFPPLIDCLLSEMVLLWKCLVLSDRQSKSQRYSVYDDIKQREAANMFIGEAETSECLTIFLEKWLKRWSDNQKSTYLWINSLSIDWMTALKHNYRPLTLRRIRYISLSLKLCPHVSQCVFSYWTPLSLHRHVLYIYLPLVFSVYRNAVKTKQKLHYF